jgi:putative inorganic carbon (HCO3(-)) transporter
MTASAPEMIGILAACGGAAAALVVRDRRLWLAVIAVALCVAPVIVLGSVWGEPRVVDFRTSASQIGAALVVGGIALAALVALFLRYRPALPIAALAVLPLRVPIDIGGETANLLVPLYLVIAAGAIAEALRGTGPVANGTREGWALWLRWVLAATLVLYAIQSSYSVDVANAIENIGFFLVPFAILLCLLAEQEWTEWLLGRVLITVAAVASVCAAIAIYQYFARDLFLNPELLDANELHVYFRANSLFFDPNILGRYLALAITALAAYMAWGRSRAGLAMAVAAAGLCLVGIAFSYSITSLASLLAGLGMVALLRWAIPGAAAAAGIGAVGLVALLVAGGTPTSDIETDRSIDSGHYDLVRGGLELAGVLEHEDRDGETTYIGKPIAGYGSGSFGRAFYDHVERARTTVSHSEPITVAAEQGAIGFVVYLGLLVISLVTLLGAGAARSVARTAVGACFVALLVDSFGYTGFAIDPAMWALLGIGIALRRAPPDAPATISG